MIDSQVKMLFPYWPDAARWFVVGGPGTDLEAQAVKERYPHVECVGFEPNPLTRREQERLHFPGRLHPCALWNNNTDRLTLTCPAGFPHNRGSVCRPDPSPDMGQVVPGDTYTVEARTLDWCSREYGPFLDVVLWLDVEHAELQALQGAAALLEQVLLLNVEAYAHLSLSPIVRLLGRYGLVLKDVWNVGPTVGKDAQDYIFARR